MTVPVLIIDTSIIGVSMAIADMHAESRATILWQKIHPENMGSVPAIGRMLQEGLAQCQLDVTELAGICVSSGPGSFTGIKVGLAYAFGMKLARPKGIPMLGISSLECARAVIAHEKSQSQLNVFLPATKTHGFMATEKGSFLLDVGNIEQQNELGTSSNDSCNLIFNSWPLLVDLLTAKGKSFEIIDEIRMCNAAVYGMAEVAKKNWPNGFGVENPAPKYLRLSTAEEKLIADQTAAKSPV
jgi:tRNA threonylcarbamoyl adenosine modification protein YeaZ